MFLMYLKMNPVVSYRLVSYRLAKDGGIQGWANSNQIKSTQKRLHLKSNHEIFESRQIKSRFEAKNQAQIKSNHDLIPISNQKLWRNQNQAT